ncbi:unnamed protein product [[Candida] boidinii]|uniref:Aspartokinase n=1 Tax=Candida boidinii TaxID=5477 RepID=A0A9W6SUT6_CANBO|nr:hypothetical protein B5S30_g3984 [[Candida] boidinii]OWB84297.1 hypothetical protein B5S33_g2940 [[Candida] boidinii]GME66725.1 unnamed protein product [[Candida] boidinii]
MSDLSSSTTSLKSVNPHGWVVQKFGGTSVGKFAEEICDDVIKQYLKTNNVAVVCSARSTHTKSEGTTTRLLKASELAADDDEEGFKQVLKLIEDDHVSNAKLRIKDLDLQKKLIEETVEEINEVGKLLNACCVIGEISSKTNDTIMACGEKLSCRFMSCLLQDRGVDSKYIDLSHIIPLNFDELFNKSGSTTGGLDYSFYKYVSDALAEEINKLDENVVPVFTGYFGFVPGGLLSAVGRGYTDLCAALVAVGISAEELQIWKEVDGIFTADPRKVKTARLLKSVTPDEAAELTYYGSEVIHPFTMEQVIKAKIPIRIKNVENPVGEGTIIYPDNLAKKGEQTPPHPPVALTRLPSTFFNQPKTATAVTAKNDIAVLNIHSNKKTLSHGFLANVFGILDRHRLVVDLISTSEVHVSMAIHNTKELRRDFNQAIEELKKYGDVDLTKDLAIVSLVGIHMKQLIGIAGTMFKTLADEGINIEMISQGANEINISCVIDQKNTVKALQALHAKILDIPYSNKLSGLDNRVAELRLDL